MKPSTILPAIALFTNNRALGTRRQICNPLEGIDIKREFELICQKKSNLSASLRRLVVRRYEQGGIEYGT